MNTSKINKDAKTLVNIMTNSEDVFLLTQEVNKILSKRNKDLAVSISKPSLNQIKESEYD